MQPKRNVNIFQGFTYFPGIGKGDVVLDKIQGDSPVHGTGVDIGVMQLAGDQLGGCLLYTSRCV